MSLAFPQDRPCVIPDEVPSKTFPPATSDRPERERSLAWWVQPPSPQSDPAPKPTATPRRRAEDNGKTSPSQMEHRCSLIRLRLYSNQVLGSWHTSLDTDACLCTDFKQEMRVAGCSQHAANPCKSHTVLAEHITLILGNDHATGFAMDSMHIGS